MADMVPPAENFAFTTSRYFPEWLASSGCALAFTTYKTGKLFLIGSRPDGQLSIFERSFPRSMGVAAGDDGRTLFLGTEYQILRFDNVVREEAGDGFDALFAPHAAWITGDIDIHDVGFGTDGRPLFVATLFSCIATVSDGHSFRPVWKPRFISRLAAEDRCHLNGMALSGGEPAYATAVSRSDSADGWRDRRASGGVLIDVASGEIVTDGLSMPHSPRLYDGRLWLLNSGSGEFGHVDLASGQFVPVAFCPGYARGLAFTGKFAIIGLSSAREDRTFQGLALDEGLRSRDTDPRCGLAVIDLQSGDMVASARIEGLVRELYDVIVLPGTRQPSLVGFKTTEVKSLFSIDA